jgi:glycosyltransferase involved in cell wall biosynthesis
MISEKTENHAMTAGANSPAVSVIIPSFNRAWCLGEAVDSVLAQEFRGFELIVVDDGSTDGTPRLLAAYGDAIRVLRRENGGVSAARNAGIAAARAALIAFLDSDDLWLPGKLAQQVAFFARHPEALICQTEETWVRNGRRVNPGKRHRKRGGMIFEPSLALCLVSPSAVMVRRELFDRVGLFDETLPACEDYDLWLRVACRHPIHLIDSPLIVKRGGHSDQLSRGWGLDRYRIASIVNLLEGRRLTDEQRRAAVRVLHQKCAVVGGGCRRRGRLEEGAYYDELAAWGEETVSIPGFGAAPRSRDNETA